ncbi:TonB-dependent receptor [uncultured Bacteroides sp.]|uniref:TonB-dependent receptor n=1 Tax=uncultured Bacteroides sp. TaxID=162156 RepID=UPI0025ED7975|nr:TonB-dependent receptor [uncultured Bacteroides sp.]
MRKVEHFQRQRYLKYVVLALLFYPLSVLGAQGKISIKGQSISITQAIKQIEKSSNYTFFYNAADLKNTKNKSINCEGSIETVLKEVFEGSGISYIIKDNEVILKVEKTNAQQQTKKRTITGTVTASDNQEPIIGASVWLKNSSVGAITDIDGKYSIHIEGIGGALEFSYMGYKKKEVAIGDQKVINIVLDPDTEVLDEVVVVGYGSQKKASVIGAISTLDVGQLKVPGSSISSVLAGQLAGVVSMSRSGEPGKNSAADFYIRGVSSFKGTSTPLVLVDGIERELDLVDTEDIASFSILKDASASAVYGVRGANGVILITTKKGKSGKPAINVRTEFGFTSPTKKPQMAGSAEWAEMYNEAYQTKYYSDDVIRKYRDGSDSDIYPNVDWFDALFNDMAANQRVNLSINGGGDIVKYYVSGSFYNESSIYKTAGNIYGYDSSIRYNKFNFRANVDINVTPSTLLNVNLANIYEKSFGPGFGDNDNDIWGYTFATSPNAFPVEYSDGKLSGPSTDSGYNPWNMLVHSGYREQFWNSSQSLIGITQDFEKIWEPLKGLTANVKFSWDAWNTTLQRRAKIETFYHAHGRAEDGSLIYDDNNKDGIWDPVHTGSSQLGFNIGRKGTMTTYLEGSLNYNRLFADKHRVGALLLYNQKIKTNTQAGDGNAALPFKNQGLAGRVTYAFKDTYFVEGNIGYNGSENFARGHRFGFFPAAAIGWMASSEKWFEPATKVIDLLKFKASYGKVGNDDIGGQRRWVYESTIVDSDSFKYGKDGSQGGSGIRVGEVENLTASWEEALKLNIGIEMSLFNKLKIQGDYFREERTGIFLQRQSLPAMVGLSTIPYVNVGETLNQGFDGTVEYSQQIGQVFVTARGNFTYTRNELINNDQPDYQYKYQNRIGKPFGSNGALQPFGLVALGLFQSQEEIDNSPEQTFGEYRVGDIKYQDLNGDGKVDELDMRAIGYTNLPEIIYGFGATAQWKNWDVNVFFQGVSHTSFFLGGSSITSPFSSGNMERSAINKDVYGKVWMSTNTDEQNANVIYPRLSRSGGEGSSNNSKTSTWWMRDGSFMRLKNFELGYTMPKAMMSKTFIKSLRFYVSGSNLLTFSNFKLWDPEKGNSDGSGYPLNRVFTIGFNANF